MTLSDIVLFSLGMALVSQSTFPIGSQQFRSNTLKKSIITHQTLLTSHLPKALINQFQNVLPQPYATGHEFYDAEVVLMNEAGNLITFRDPLKKEESYRLVSVGVPHVTANLIWFFSPNGVELTDGNFLTQCTAELPCKNITQNLLNYLDTFSKSGHSRVKLWFASGSYDLPANPTQNSAKMIDLSWRISVAGRTADFKHVAYDNERPILNGTLSWNDYIAHGGSYAYIENLRIKTQHNKIQVEDTYVDVNVHATGGFVAINSDLQKNNSDWGGNIYAEYVSLADSTLTSAGVVSINIESKDAYVLRSHLDTKGHALYNLKSSDGYTIVEKSQLESHLNTCPSPASAHYKSDSFAIEGGRTDGIYVIHSKILMDSIRTCHSGSMFAISIGDFQPAVQKIILNSAVDSTSEFRIIVSDSEIQIKNTNGKAVSIDNSRNPVTFSANTVKVESLNDEAYAFTGYETSLEFTEEPSMIQVISPLTAILYAYPLSMLVTNNSKTPSQCKINNNASMDC